MEDLDSANGDQVNAIDDLIPPPEVVDQYVPRKVHGGHGDLELLDWARMMGDNVLIKGPTGPGKTMLCRTYCALKQIPFVHINPGTAIEPSMLTGKEVLHEASTRWVDGVLTAALRRGDCLVLFDELNFWPPGVTGFLHSLTDDARYLYLYDHLIEHFDDDGTVRAMPEIIRAGERILFVAAYNPDYEGTFRPNQAFENRFAVQLHWGYSADVEESLISLPTLLSIASDLRRMHANGEISVPVSTNRLMYFQRMTDDLGLSAAIDNFVSYFDGTENEAVRNVFMLKRTSLEDEIREETGRDPDLGRFVE